MPKIAKKFLIGGGVFVGLLAIALLVVNLYLQSEGVQSRIQTAATSALGGSIKTGGSLYTPWGGFVINKISVPSPSNTEENLLEADSLRIRFALLPLLQGRMLIKQVVLANPTLRATQDENGNWIVLLPPPPQQNIPVTIPDRDKGTSKSFQVTVESIRIQGAKAIFVDTKGRVVMRAEKSDFEAKIHDDKTSSGVFDIGNLEIAEVLRPRRIGGPFTWDGKTLDMPEIQGGLGGGKIRGNFQLHTGAEQSFTLGMNISEAKLEYLTKDAGGKAEGTSGELNGQINLTGDPRDTNALQGTATLSLDKAKFTPVDFLVQFGQMFGVDELQKLQLSEATSQFTIHDGRVDVEKIFLQSENLILTGTGTAEFSGDLDIDAALLVNKKLQRSLRAVMGKNFVKTEDPEFKKLEFSVTNTLAEPKTDLLDKLVGARVGQDIGGLLQNFLRPSAPKKDKPKEEPKN